MDENNKSIEKEVAWQVPWTFLEETGILWYINTVISVYGVCIVIKRDKNGKRPRAVPIRTRFRGFADVVNDQEIVKLTRYIASVWPALLEEVEDGQEEEDS